MEYEDIKHYEGKEAKMLLANGFIYNCRVLEVNKTSTKIIDKFCKSIVISNVIINLITPVEND